jgi:arylsulfatase A-like enzyme
MKVIYFDIDTLRPDHMGCYGYPRNTTPNIDKIAEEGVRFNNCYCSDAPCLPSRAALVTGMFGIHSGVVGHGGTAADKRYMGAERSFVDWSDLNGFNTIFRKTGMHTASISSFPERHSAWWYNAGLNEVFNVGEGGMESGEKVLPIVMNWLDNNSERDSWYLHVNLWDPHTPYRVPMDFGNPFENDPMPEWITDEVMAEHLKHVGPNCLNELNMYDDSENPAFPRNPGAARNLDDVKRVFDGYDTGIRYADYIVGQIVQRLKDSGDYNDMAIIVSSDHGENMGELGIYGEHATADHSTCHIPMIIKWPGGKKGIADDGFHYNLDLGPTMVDLLQMKQPPRLSFLADVKKDGISYAKTITDGENTGRDYLVISQMAHVCQRSARFGKWLYMRTYHDGFHLFDKEMLFDLESDPYEQHDLKEQRPEICAQGAKIILDWHDEMMACSKSQIDPLWTVLQEGGPFHTVGCLYSYLSRLESTGRSEGAKKLRERHR